MSFVNIFSFVIRHNLHVCPAFDTLDSMEQIPLHSSSHSLFARMLRRPLFYVVVALGCGLRYLLSAQEVISFGFFNTRTTRQNLKIGEEYIKQSLVDDTIVGTTLANISLWHGQTFARDNIVNDALRLFKTSTALVTVDILQLVTSSKNPEQALQTHLDHTQNTLSQIDRVGRALQQLAQEHYIRSQECYASKQAWDELFFQGASATDAALAQAGLAQSIDVAPCYITNRVHANAYTFLAEKVITHQSLLSSRYDILTQNKELLLTHTAYLDDAVLAQLVWLKTKLRQVNQTSYNDVKSAFWFNFLAPDAPLPTFRSVWWEPWKEPTFEDSWLDWNTDNFRFDVSMWTHKSS